MDTQTTKALDVSAVKAELLKHLKSKLTEAEGWVFRNTEEGFPDAAESWRSEVVKWQQCVDLVESPPVMAWHTKFENGAVELYLGEQPTVGRWVTPLGAVGDVIDLAPKTDVGSE